MNNTDIFLMIPVSGTLDPSFGGHSEMTEEYNRILSETSMYECDEGFAATIQRKELGRLKISYMSDEYGSAESEWIDVYCCYAYQKVSGLGLFEMILPSFQKEDSQIGDILFSGNMRIKSGGSGKPFKEFLAGVGLKVSGAPRAVYCNSLAKKR